MLSAAEHQAVGASSPNEAATRYLESLGQFGMRLGLDRIRNLLASLGNPERAFPAIHVVGTNGKSTTARMIEAILESEGCRVGTYVSPHVTGWSERIRVAGNEIDVAEPVAGIRDAVGDREITQFEVLTAAAFVTFADQAVDVAVVEAGLGGRYDATNVLGAGVVVLTNVALDHTAQLGTTRGAIAAEKLAVVTDGSVVVLGESEWESEARRQGAAEVRVAFEASNLACATEAAAAFLGRAVRSESAENVVLPGRLEQRGEAPPEIWDGAHNPAAVRFLLSRLPSGDVTLVLSILADKDVDEMLRLFSARASHVVVTTSGSDRALAADDLARRAAGYFTVVDTVRAPLEAVEFARRAAGPTGTVVVAGSLALLEELAAVRPGRLP